MLALRDEEVTALGAGGFILRDELLGPPIATAVAAEAAALPGFRRAGVARTARLHPGLRGDQIVWLHPAAAPPALARLAGALEIAGREIDAAAYLGLGPFDVQVARYPGGGARYDRHRDAFAGDAGRLLTVIYYANPGWRPDDGG